jgi:hypothetical protein
VQPNIEGEDPASWKLIGKFKQDFQAHYSYVITEAKYGIFLLGGTGRANCFQFKNKNITIKSPMPEKSFFSTVYLKGMIYTFGGYDNYEKI